MPVTRTEILRLYKNLILYSKSLTLTDPAYFKRRVATEYRKNKDLSKTEDITFAYKITEGMNETDRERRALHRIRLHKRKLRKAKHYYIEGLLSKMLSSVNRLQSVVYTRICTAFKHTIDYSKVPKINEYDLSENFVRGSGPGGSAVNKNSNCVVLTHVPTGIVVKCHTSRCQDDNRKTAREMLIAKLDEDLNGENSVAAQRKRLEEKKYKRSEYKKKKMSQLKNDWKKREGIE